MATSNTSIALGPLIIVLIGAVALLFVILPFLQKRLRIFTRGTLAFMISSLMAFTLVDGIVHLNEIRNSERRLKIEAREASVASLLQSFFASGVGAAMEQVPFHLHRDTLHDSLKVMEQEIADDLTRKGSRAQGFPDLKLVALDVGQNLVSTARRWNPVSHLGAGWDWGFRAILDDGEQFLCYEGYMRVNQESGGPVTIMHAHGTLTDNYGPDESKVAYLYRDSRCYQNEAYQLSSQRGGYRLVSAR